MQIEKKAEYRNYPMRLSILSDFKDNDLEDMMDLGVKYSRLGSYANSEPILQSSWSSSYTPRDLCDGFSLYSTSHSNSTSWASAIIIAAQAALKNTNVMLSLGYVFECLPEFAEESINDITPTDIMEFITENGLMSEYTYNKLKEEKQDVCSADVPKYRFEITRNDIPNKSGLMNFVAEGNPVIVLMALDLVRLKTVNDVTGDFIYTGAAEEPSLYGVMKGYDEKKWTVTFNVVPCENIEINLPIAGNDTSANYAGIAGYAFSLSLKSAPTENIPTEAPTTEAPTTVTPTTVAPTTVTPTTVTPTTVTPTTVAPTTVAPTTVTPTTVAPTTVTPTTVAPTTVAPTTVAPTTVAPTTVTPIEGKILITIERVCGDTSRNEESFEIYQGEDIEGDAQLIVSQTSCEPKSYSIYVSPVVHTIVLRDSQANGWDSNSKIIIYWESGLFTYFTMDEVGKYESRSTFNLGTPAPEPSKEIVVDDTFGSLDNIPQDVTKLTFKEGSFSEMTSLTLDLPNLKYLIFEDNTFSNADYMQISAPLLEEMTFGRNCFSKSGTSRRLLDVTGRFVLDTPLLKFLVVGSDSMLNINTVVLIRVHVEISLDLSVNAMKNVNKIEYRIDISMETVNLVKDSIESTEGHEESVGLETTVAPTEAPIVPTTETPVIPTTAAPTEAPTVAVPTTETPVIPTTAAPTEAPTEAPTVAVPTTETPVIPTTAAPTEAPTEAPIVPTTETPVIPTTVAPTEAPIVPTTETPVIPTTAH